MAAKDFRNNKLISEPISYAIEANEINISNDSQTNKLCKFRLNVTIQKVMLIKSIVKKEIKYHFKQIG